MLPFCSRVWPASFSWWISSSELGQASVSLFLIECVNGTLFVGSENVWVKSLSRELLHGLMWGMEMNLLPEVQKLRVFKWETHRLATPAKNKVLKRTAPSSKSRQGRKAGQKKKEGWGKAPKWKRYNLSVEICKDWFGAGFSGILSNILSHFNPRWIIATLTHLVLSYNYGIMVKGTEIYNRLTCLNSWYHRGNYHHSVRIQPHYINNLSQGEQVKSN